MTGVPVGPRILWLDVARITAILGVITIHVVSGTAVADPLIIGSATQRLGLVFLSAATWCVPLFVMISGALLLPPPAEASTGAFYRRRLSRLLLVAVVWSLAYWAWRVGYHHQNVTPATFVRLLIVGRPYAHLYFLFVIAGLYLITPLIWVFLREAQPAQVRAAALIALGLAGVQQAFGVVDLSSDTNIVTYFIPFIGYFLAGYWLRDVVLDRRGRWIALAAIPVLVGLMVISSAVIGQVFGADEGIMPQGYLSFFTIGTTLCVFLLLRSWFGPERAPGGSPRWLAAAAAATFGVYLIHPIVLDLWRTVADIGTGRYRNLVVFPTSVLVVGLLSLVIVMAIKRIPLARQVVG